MLVLVDNRCHQPLSGQQRPPQALPCSKSERRVFSFRSGVRRCTSPQTTRSGIGRHHQPLTRSKSEWGVRLSWLLDPSLAPIASPLVLIDTNPSLTRLVPCQLPPPLHRLKREEGSRFVPCQLPPPLRRLKCEQGFVLSCSGPNCPILAPNASAWGRDLSYYNLDII